MSGPIAKAVSTAINAFGDDYWRLELPDALKPPHGRNCLSTEDLDALAMHMGVKYPGYTQRGVRIDSDTQP